MEANRMTNFDYTKEPGKTRVRGGYTEKIDPLITIVTVVGNITEEMEQTANSVLDQTFPWFEWIVVYSGDSETNTDEKLEKLKESDARIKVIHHLKKGLLAARNVGIENSTTEIIVSLKCFDLIDQTFLECLYWTLETNKDAGIAYVGTVEFDEKKGLAHSVFDMGSIREANIQNIVYGIRKGDLVAAGYYDEEEGVELADLRVWLKALNNGRRLIHMNFYGYWHRVKVSEKNIPGDQRTAQSEDFFMFNEKSLHDSELFKTYPNREGYEGFQTFGRWDFKAQAKSNDKRKILMILPYMVVGGAEKFILDLISGMDKTRFEIHVMTSNKGDSFWRQNFEEHSEGVFDLTTFLDINQWPSFIDYYIKTHRIDVLFVSHSYFGYYVIPWIVQKHPDIKIYDYVHLELYSWRKGAYARTSAVLGGFLDKTFTCNNLTRDAIIESYGRKLGSVETAYIGVDETLFDPDKYRKGFLRNEFEIPENVRVVVFPCRIEDQKRPFLMLEIAERIKVTAPGRFAFVIVGDGPLLDELKVAANVKDLSGLVYFAGKRENMPEIYRDSDLTLVCSLTEGLSLTSYESLAMGVPCISADVGGQKELIDDSVGKLIHCRQDITKDLKNRDYSQDEVDDYVEALVQLAGNEDLLAEMKKNCRMKIIGGFTKKSMVSHFERVFSECFSVEERLNTELKHGVLAEYSQHFDDYLSLYLQFEGHEFVLDRLGNEAALLRKENFRLRQDTFEHNSLKSLTKKFIRTVKLRLFKSINDRKR